MHILSKLLFASTACYGLVTAVPVEKHKNFRVEQVSNKDYKKNGQLAYAKALGKYNASMPPAIAAVSSGDGTVGANPAANDEEYLCPVSIGGQTLNLDFDTGSSDLWVFSTELARSSQAGHKIFDPSKSRTFKKIPGASWKIQYGDGSGASGDVGTDEVNIGGAMVSGQAVELASKVSTEFISGSSSDGLLGLAFSSINTVTPNQQQTFFDNAIPSLSSPLFTADLKHAQPGSYDFGYIDNSKYAGQITYVPVDSAQGFWEFTANGYQVGNGDFNSQTIDAIADTGTTLLLTTDAIVQDYYSKVVGAQLDSSQGGYTFPCDATLPDFAFQVSGYDVVIAGSLVNFAPIDSSSTACFGGIQSNQGLGMSIFGDILFKSQAILPIGFSLFVIFDNNGGSPRLGFASKP